MKDRKSEQSKITKQVREALIKIRESKGITAYRLAKMTGIPQQTISNFENDNCNTTLDHACRMCEAMNVEVSLSVKEMLNT